MIRLAFPLTTPMDDFGNQRELSLRALVAWARWLEEGILGVH